ncbi:MAG: hypothetical protein IT317_09950 [Anaerolineales bacterium]|nr:hypothetical protein [Anaerolineales bacterium]
MKLFCYPHANFGDGPLNNWLWPQLIPGLLDECGDQLFVGIGSLLNDMLPREPLKAVLGTGIGYGQGTPRPDGTWRIYAVRGPRSAQALGLDARAAITDAAMLVRALNLPARPKRHPVAYMPHWWSDAHGQWRAACDLAGLYFIDPQSGAEAVLNDLRETELLISEALHGAIVADALRTPWVPVAAYKHILALKWLDWAESVELPYEPHRLEPQYQPEAVRARLRRLRGWPQHGRAAQLAEALVARPAGAVSGGWYRRQVERNARTLQHLAATAAPQLTRDAVLDRVVGRLLAALEQLKADIQAGRMVVNAAPGPVVVLRP